MLDLDLTFFVKLEKSDPDHQGVALNSCTYVCINYIGKICISGLNEKVQISLFVPCSYVPLPSHHWVINKCQAGREVSSDLQKTVLAFAKLRVSKIWSVGPII